MVKLEIVNNDNYEYELKDEEGNKYNFNLEFFDIKEKPKKGDYIYLSKELINNNTSYTFGNLESPYGREKGSLDKIDIIKVIVNNVEIYLKRLYG